MLNCMYKGKRICSLDLKNKYKQYIFEKVKELKEAGECNLLTCEECGSLVKLRAGETNIPHFYHINKVNCYYNSNYFYETEEHKRGKNILYQYLKELFKTENVQVNYRHSNRRISDIFIEFNSGKKLAIEYQRKDIRFSNYKQRHENYKDNNIKDIWILSYKEYSRGKKISKKIGFFEELVIYSNHDKIVKFLNTDNKEITFVKKLEYFDKQGFLKTKKLYHKSYNLDKLTLNEDGEFITDFNNLFKQQRDSFINIENEKKVKTNVVINSILNHMKNQHLSSPINNKINSKINDNVAFETFKSQALESKNKNPNGPWFDSQNNRWGYCVTCGVFTKKWRLFYGYNNTCLCYECKSL